MNTREAADYIRYSVHALQYWRSHGGGPPFIKVNGRRIMYRQSDLDEWIDSHGKQRTTSEYTPKATRKRRKIRRERLTDDAKHRVARKVA